MAVYNSSAELAILKSLVKTCASLPILRTVAATSFNLFPALAVRIKFAPRFARSSAIANPMPEGTPFTKTVLFLKDTHLDFDMVDDFCCKVG